MATLIRPPTARNDGTLEWRSPLGQYDRADGPAIIRPDGTREWWRAGHLHRDHGKPAVIRSDNTREFWVHGRLHRDNDLPASEGGQGRATCWYIAGQLHRDHDQPAVIDPRYQRWYTAGILHRVHGPAEQYTNGTALWHIWGHQLTTAQTVTWVQLTAGQQQIAAALLHDDTSFADAVTAAQLLDSP